MQRPRVLYLAYWGALEPLGQSLVVPAVRRLADLGAHLTLVTFEKPTDASDVRAMAALKDALRQKGVEWIPLRYRKKPQLAAKVWDIMAGVSQGLQCRLASRIDVVHARTFVGGVMGLLLAPLIGARLVFHNEGFYPDEQVDGGVWGKESWMHRAARAIEDRLYKRAEATIVLSNRARDTLSRRYSGRHHRTTVVVPSAVDLDLFQRRDRRSERETPALRLVYVGAIGLRYEFHRVAAFAALAEKVTGSVHLRVLTRTDRREVRNHVEASGLDSRHWSLASLPHAKMPDELVHHDAGLFFLTRGLSEHACSPTKIGEYWASGLPVITTPNVSDTDQIIRTERVGVVVEEHTPESYELALRAVLELLSDPETPDRCRCAAETHYGLEAACQRQMSLYRELLSSSIGADD